MSPRTPSTALSPRHIRPPLAQTLLEPFTYLTATPGKDMRAQLIDAFNVWLNVPSESIGIVKQVVGQLHTASLL